MLQITILAVIEAVQNLLKAQQIERAQDYMRLLKLLCTAQQNGGRIEITTHWLNGGGYASVNVDDWDSVDNAIIWLIPSATILSPAWMAQRYNDCAYLGSKCQGQISTPLPNFQAREVS